MGRFVATRSNTKRSIGCDVLAILVLVCAGCAFLDAEPKARRTLVEGVGREQPN